MKYSVIKKVKNHLEIQNMISLPLWPEFMLHDPVAIKYWSKLFEYFPDYQFTLKSEGEYIGMANCIPIYWDKPLEELPEKGWDWVFKKGIDDYENKRKPNILNGLQIAVNKEHQKKGISSIILKEMVNLAKEKGFEKVIIPVRPSLKSLYPLIFIDSYINWKREDNLPYDPWLRVHIRFGGKIIKVCHEAMYISGTIKEWEKWTGLRFFESGEYIVKGGLNPVKIDLNNDIGEYVEPNIWVLHEVNN